MIIKYFEFNPFAENTYVLHDSTDEAVIIDPGCYEKQEQDILVNYISDHGLQVVKVLNTHCHIDHVLGNQFVKDKYDVKLVIHKDDLPLLRSVKSYAPNYGFNMYKEAEADEFYSDGDTFKFGESSLEVIHVPGHAPGHIALVHHDSKSIINGDVLFRSSIGRTDLPGGDYDTLIDSIQGKLFNLPDDYTVYCGHGPTTTIGLEKRTNPFCKLN